MSYDFYLTMQIMFGSMGIAAVGMYFDTELMYDRINRTDAYGGEIFDDIGVSMEDRIGQANNLGGGL